MDTNEKLEQYISNQRRGNRFTMIIVIVFIGLAISTIVFAMEYTKTTKELREKKDQLEVKNDSLYKMAKKLDSTINQTAILTQTLKNNIGNYDTLLKTQHHEDSLYFTSKYEVKPRNPARPDLPAKPPVVIKPRVAKTTVYIQYQPEMGLEKDLVEQQLKEKNIYKLPQAEMVDLNYRKEIRYFHTHDSTKAKTLYKILGRKYKVVRVKSVKAPANQLEVWIGNPKILSVQKQYEKYKK